MKEYILMVCALGSTAVAMQREEMISPEQLFQAVEDKDSVRVRRQLDGKVALNAVDKDGYTPLHHAVLNDQFACAKLLLARGARIDAGGLPVYKWAVSNRLGNQMLLLYDYLSDHDAFLSWLIERQDSQMLQLLIDHGKLTVDRDFLKWLLTLCKEQKRVGLALAFVDKMIACQLFSSLVDLVVRHGTLDQLVSLCAKRGDYTFIPDIVHRAVDCDKPDMVSFFVSKGIAKEGASYSALLYRLLSISCVASLREPNPWAQVTQQVLDKATKHELPEVFYQALCQGDIPVIELLLQHDALLRFVQYAGKSWLQHAVMQCHEGVVSCLLRNGANPLCSMEDGGTVVDWAIKN